MPQEQAILTISIAAKLLGLHQRTLMLYEKSGLISPHRTSTQRRLFSVKDLNRLQFIKHLTRKKGVNLNGIKLLFEAIEVAESNGIRLKRRLFPTFKLKKLI